MTTITDYSPFAAEVKANPYPYYAWLREEEPVYYNARLDLWALSRYADVMLAARTPEVFFSYMGVGPDKRHGLNMISNDPPVHTRLRLLVSKAFTPRMVEQYAPRIQAIIDELCDAVVAKGTFELIEDLALPLPITVIAEILGVAPERRTDFKRWSDEVVHFIAGTPHGHPREQYQQSWEEFTAYFSQVIEKRRQEPRHDLISMLVMAQEAGDSLSMIEVLNFCQLLLVAGNETTTNLIGNAVLALSAHPEQERMLRDHPALIPSLVEEVLRYDSPVQLLFRTTTRDVEIHGTTIPAGSKVALLWAAANRDPEVFADPDRFDIARTPNQHVAFGYGIHYCLGAPLARLEARLAGETLLRRLKGWRPDPSDPYERLSHPLLRGLQRFPLLCEFA